MNQPSLQPRATIVPLAAPLGAPDLRWGHAGRTLALSALVLVIASLPVFGTTFINDDATYALIAQKLNQGGLLYRDAVDNKPPLIYLTFATVFALTGTAGMAAVKLTTMTVNAGSVALVFLIGRALFDRRIGLAAAFFFACALVSGVAEDALGPNTESYANLFALLALALLAHRSHSACTVVLAGAAGAVATLYRIQAIVVFAGLFWLLLVRRRPGSIALLALGALAPLLAVIVHFAGRGTLGELWRWVVLHNIGYVRVGQEDGITARKIGRIAGVLGSELPLLLAAAAGLALGRSRRPRDREAQGLLFSQLAFGLVAYQAGDRFYGHYFIQLLPFVALLAGWAVVTRMDEAPALRLTPRLALVWVAGFAAYNTFALARGDAPRQIEAAGYVSAHVPAGGCVLLWGGAPLVAFASQRSFATRFAFNNHLTGRVFGTTHAAANATRAANESLEEPEAWRLFWDDVAADAPPPSSTTAPPALASPAIPSWRATCAVTSYRPFASGR